MTCHLRLIVLLNALTLICFNLSIHASQFTSNIFSYDDPNAAKGLHVKLAGEGWQAEDIKESHIKFHQDLFANPHVMRGFADGQIREPEATKDRCYTSINQRFKEGHPHGLLTVIDHATQQPFMHIVGGLGDRKGTSEIAYAMIPEYYGKKYGIKVVGALVEKWAPEVRRIGLGTNLDLEAHANIINAFRCFSDKEGKKELEQLDATASPSNVASWKILDKVAFQAANCDLSSHDVVINYEHKEFTGNRNEEYKEMEQKILNHFDPLYTPSPLKSAQRYRMVDIDGKERTFSKHQKWDRIKYHFEKKVE